MNISWQGDKCIVCLDDSSLTREHIIPSVLGGILTCKFLCKRCNSLLGSSVEASVKTDPSIRLAVKNLRATIPVLSHQLTEGQDYVSQGPGGTERGTIHDGEFRVSPHKNTDDSLTLPTPDARDALTNILRKRGDAHLVAEVLRNFDAAPENEKISLAPGLHSVIWPIEHIELDLSGNEPMSPLVPLKIAYEFIALHLGTEMYDKDLEMSKLRSVIRGDQIEHDPYYSIEPFMAGDYRPFHGIAFEGNHPHATLQIRFFGKLGYRVHLKQLAVGGRQLVYTHRLDSNEDIFKLR